MPLIPKRGKLSRPSGQWQHEDFDVLADDKAIGRIYEDARGWLVEHVDHVGDVVYRHACKLGSEPLTIEMSAHLCWVGIRPPVTAANSLSASTRFSSLA
jgi:hypothetical protein